MQTLKEFDIDSRRDKEHTSVWVDDEKNAAVGVSSARWINTYGFAVNVDVELKEEGRGVDKRVIVPCGIEGRGVTLLRRVSEERTGGSGGVCPTVEEVGKVVVRCFGEVFGVDMVHGDEIQSR
mmetsp:Transcript_2568/g.4944  ORF Transcript_2568/g.4944 Transcript_2568/m.4944 type:complete len:123 (+) Transcript_2568:88-456(+)